MRLITCQYRQLSHLGIIRDDSVILPGLDSHHPPEFEDMLSLIEGGAQALSELRRFTEKLPNTRSSA